tara:strand:- start:15959 stop:16234 length:276 start_codon:yes stop_codon:yes gene_type:complete
MRIFLLLLVIGLLCFPSYSQETSKKELRQAKKEKRKAKKQKKLDEGKFMITPVAAPGYTPELGGLLAVGGLRVLKQKKPTPLFNVLHCRLP